MIQVQNGKPIITNKRSKNFYHKDSFGVVRMVHSLGTVDRNGDTTMTVTPSSRKNTPVTLPVNVKELFDNRKCVNPSATPVRGTNQFGYLTSPKQDLKVAFGEKVRVGDKVWTHCKAYRGMVEKIVAAEVGTGKNRRIMLVYADMIGRKGKGNPYRAHNPDTVFRLKSEIIKAISMNETSIAALRATRKVTHIA